MLRNEVSLFKVNTLFCHAEERSISTLFWGKRSFTLVQDDKDMVRRIKQAIVNLL